MSRNPVSAYRTGLEQALDQLQRRMNAMYPLEISVDEVLELAAPRTHHLGLRQAAEIIGEHSNYQTNLFVRDILDLKSLGEQGRVASYGKICFDLGYRSKSPVLPEEIKFRSELVGTPLIEEITSWVTDRLNVGLQFGRVHLILFKHLNETCKTIEQVRYFFPSIIPLLRMHQSFEKYADKLQTISTPRKLPSLDVKVRHAIGLAATTITSALLLPDPEKPEPTVKCSLVPNGWGTFTPSPNDISFTPSIIT